MLEVNMGQVYPKRLSRRQRKAQRADALRLDVRRGASLQMSRAVVFGSAAREPVPLTMPEVRLASISETLSGILPPITERVRPESVEETMRSVGTAVPLSTVFDLSLAPMVPANVWTPRHGGGATMTVGGADVVEIEPSAAEPNALFCVWSDRRWRVERMGEDPERWEVEIRSGSASLLCAGPNLEQTIADAMMVDGVNQRR